MSMDLSSLNSISSLLGSTYGTNAATSPVTSGTSFENYLMNALGTNSATSTSGISSLLDQYSNGGTNALLSGLTSSSGTSDMASQLLSSLQASGTSAPGLTSLMNTTSTATATDAYTNSMANSFQSQLLNNMNAAKAKLQSSFDGFIERMGEKPSASAQYRIEQMQQNISLIENYMASKSTNNADSLLGQLTGADSAKAATNHSLVNQLDAKSALTQQMLNL